MRAKMGVNRDKPDRWKEDISLSVDLYNEWFLLFAPKAFRENRIQTAKEVENAFMATRNLTDIQPEVLHRCPEILSTLRMSTCPPLAKDRLIGLSKVRPGLVNCMEKKKKIRALKSHALEVELRKIGDIIGRMADPDVFPWLTGRQPPRPKDIHRAAIIVADRLCGSVVNPIIRNAQEARQLKLIRQWLESKSYRFIASGSNTRLEGMPPGTFCFHANFPVKLTDNGVRTVNISVDVVVARKKSHPGTLPLLIEAKSAGDFANVNKRRKEEAVKMAQLKRTFGDQANYILFLCGYFDSGYLGYEAAEGIDWVWEHRINDLAEFGV